MKAGEKTGAVSFITIFFSVKSSDLVTFIPNWGFLFVKYTKKR